MTAASVIVFVWRFSWLMLLANPNYHGWPIRALSAIALASSWNDFRSS